MPEWWEGDEGRRRGGRKKEEWGGVGLERGKEGTREQKERGVVAVGRRRGRQNVFQGETEEGEGVRKGREGCVTDSSIRMVLGFKQDEKKKKKVVQERRR